jgi:hypothetical protein
MEQKLWNNELQEYALHEYVCVFVSFYLQHITMQKMSQERRKIQESKHINREALLQNLLSLEELLYDKAQRTYVKFPYFFCLSVHFNCFSF